MENKMIGRSFLPILCVFIVSTVCFAVGKTLFAGWNMDNRVLLVGNCILFATTVLSFYLYSKVLRSSNVHAFVRMMYASLLIRMVFCLVATLLYLFFAGHEVSKYAILGCFVLYILYTGMEVKVLMQLSRRAPKNA